MNVQRNLLGIALVCGILIGSLEAATGPPLEELHTAEQVRRLSAQEADKHYPVHLKGTLTFFDQRAATKVYQFVQDETAGIYFHLDPSVSSSGLAAGQQVEIKGRTAKGAFAPVVQVNNIRIIGPGVFPLAKPVSFEQLTSGQEDSQFVEIKGIVRAVEEDPQTHYRLVEMAAGGGRLTAYAAALPPVQGKNLADSTVRVRGVCFSQFNLRRQLFDIRLLLPSPADLVVEKPAPDDPFAVPAQSLNSLLQFTPEGAYGHRVKVAGTVIYRQEDRTLYIQDTNEGLYVETRQRGVLSLGDQVEAVGFPAKGEYTPMLQDAIFRKVGSGAAPAPDRVNADEALNGTHDCRLVRIEATLLDRARHTREQFLVLETGGFIFHAYLERQGDGVDFANLQNGSKVAVTGVCLIETGKDWFAGHSWRAKSFRVLLRSPEDVAVLERPPWWTLGKLLWALGVLGAVMLGAFAWVAILRHRVRQQTGIIRQKLQAEAALKERYEDLFENANDMVFTHDLDGRITSVNKAGERLLQLPRAQIVGHNLADLVAEEDRAEAGEWLQAVVKGGDLPAAEWDFITGAGQRLKLELSARIVEQAGKDAEVEAIARDITERKRLEKEILEVSNREQQRIGHDLHDGVCQHLAAIAYMTDILADSLQEKGDGASAQAEKISAAINETITQTRSVARGLFPVRLEENGLASALEELAANAGSMFRINCRFDCEAELPTLENAAALHLYYIAQEAVLNAAKHAKAGKVVISLGRAHDRLTLTVEDDGIGFQPSGATGTGMGIRIMRYRARVIGATLDLKSQPGHGTRISCSFLPAHRETAQRSVSQVS